MQPWIELSDWWSFEISWHGAVTDVIRGYQRVHQAQHIFNGPTVHGNTEYTRKRVHPPMTHRFLYCFICYFFLSLLAAFSSYILFLLRLAVGSSDSWLAWLVFQHVLERTFRYVFHFQRCFVFLKLANTSCDQVVTGAVFFRTSAVSWPLRVDGTRMSFSASSAVLTPGGWGTSDTSEGSCSILFWTVRFTSMAEDACTQTGDNLAFQQFSFDY